MNTNHREILAGWPEDARGNTRFGTGRPADPSLRALLLAWLRSLFGR